MRLTIAALCSVLSLVPIQALAAEPVVAVWYRGTPAGTPRQSDLGAIRALGFNGVVWPSVHTKALAEVARLAGAVGLRLIVADAPVATTGPSALRPRDQVDIVIDAATAGNLVPLAWRAVAHGARVIAFDSQSPAGAGLEESDRSLKPWVRSAISIARQLTANANLADAMRPGPALTMTPPSRSLDVVLLDAGRSWVIVATNTSAAKAVAAVRLPKGTPYALWVSWLEGPPLAMISEPAGPRWMLSLAPHSAGVYMIDKVMK